LLQEIVKISFIKDLGL